MLGTDVIRALDQRAVNLNEAQGDKDVYEFDLTLWTLLRTLAAENPQLAESQFSLSEQAVAHLASASGEHLRSLSSGVLVSFRLETKEDAILEALKLPYDPAVFLSTEVDAFDASYWLLMSRIARRDVAVAKAGFGVSRNLVVAVAEASDNQLRQLASNTLTHFSLRFSSAILVEILQSDPTSSTFFILKKLQQCLQRKVRYDIA